MHMTIIYVKINIKLELIHKNPKYIINIHLFLMFYKAKVYIC